LKDDLQPSATSTRSDQLVAICESLVPTNLILRKEALHRFLKGNTMIGELVALEIILEIGRLKNMPVYQSAPAFPWTPVQFGDLSKYAMVNLIHIVQNTPSYRLLQEVRSLDV